MDPAAVLIGAGLELHTDRARFAGWIPALAEDMATGQVAQLTANGGPCGTLRDFAEPGPR